MGRHPLLGWLVDDRGIEPHIPVFDKSGPQGRELRAQADFRYDHAKKDVSTPVRMASCSGPGKKLYRNYSDR